MIVADTSAIVAITFAEPERDAFVQALLDMRIRCTSNASPAGA